MRYLLIALMIVLLPLRGWAGNAMAVDMAAQQVFMAQASTAAMVAEPAMPAVDPKEKKPAMVDPEADTLPRIEPDPKKKLPEKEPPATPREGKQR